MKLFIVLAAVTLAQAAKLDRVYLPPNALASAGAGSFLQTPHQSSNEFHGQNNGFSGASNAYSGASASNAYSSAPASNAYSGAPASNDYAQNTYSGFEARPERAQAARERNAAILRQDNSNDGETYSYAYETENGIYAEESGVATNGVQAQGGYSYTGDDGQVYSVRYTADENGFVPQGDHLPTPPPIPEEILKALEQNARDEAAGIYDDGTYSETKYAGADNSQQQYYNTNAQPINYSNDDSVVTNSAGFNGGAFNNGAGANNGAASNSLEKAYLPPFARNTQRNSYNARDGYRY
ncbi:uncharacterized protein LOC142979829 [Anticarsia gemmatalis]|uniref:uncharacterized protein LOC142979829 n=1 Tax=Anticarsia gemmatalis TaxID=129554 RepID=UPI003F76323A